MFFLLFLLDDRRIGPGSVSLPNASGSGWGRPKNIWILRIQIRIRNTAPFLPNLVHFEQIIWDPNTNALSLCFFCWCVVSVTRFAYLIQRVSSFKLIKLSLFYYPQACKEDGTLEYQVIEFAWETITQFEVQYRNSRNIFSLMNVQNFLSKLDDSFTVLRIYVLLFFACQI